MTILQKGRIVRLSGSWGSGLAELVVDRIEPNGDEVRVALYCDNGQTVRSLNAAFGGFIAPGHTFNNDAIKGKVIFYSTDFIGILDGFTPVDETPPEWERIWQEGGEV